MGLLKQNGEKTRLFKKTFPIYVEESMHYAFMHLFITSFGFYSPCCGSLNLAIMDCGVGEYPGLLRNVDDECGCSNAVNEVFVRTCDGDALSLSTLRTLDRVIASISCVAFKYRPIMRTVSVKLKF